jgi:hypothetical protein
MLETEHVEWITHPPRRVSIGSDGKQLPEVPFADTEVPDPRKKTEVKDKR